MPTAGSRVCAYNFQVHVPAARAGTTMPRSICLLFVLTLLAAKPLQGQSSDADTAQRVFEHAVEMQQAGDYIGAIEPYKTVLKFDPRRLDALSNLARRTCTSDNSTRASPSTSPRWRSIRRTFRSG